MRKHSIQRDDSGGFGSGFLVRFDDGTGENVAEEMLLVDLFSDAHRIRDRLKRAGKGGGLGPLNLRLAGG